MFGYTNIKYFFIKIRGIYNIKTEKNEKNEKNY